MAHFEMRTVAKSLCVKWPSVNARGGQILCVPTELAQELENYEKQKENLETLQRELNILNQKKSSLISKENKEEIIQFENELKNINRIKID